MHTLNPTTNSKTLQRYISFLFYQIYFFFFSTKISKKMIYLENKKIKLRALEPEDLDFLYKWENDTKFWKEGNNINPYSKYALKCYIENPQSIYEQKQLRMMIEEKDSSSVVGCVDLFNLDIHNLRVGIGILIDERFSNKGFATQAIGLSCQYAFDFLHLHQVYCHIAANNFASVKVFEKVGFKKNGILKDWLLIENNFVDTHIYTLLNNKHFFYKPD